MGNLEIEVHDGEADHMVSQAGDDDGSIPAADLVPYQRRRPSPAQTSLDEIAGHQGDSLGIGGPRQGQFDNFGHRWADQFGYIFKVYG